MKKTLLHRIFGWGRIPKRYAPTLHNEGIILLDEGIGGSITFKKFRAPGRYHSWKGALAWYGKGAAYAKPQGRYYVAESQAAYLAQKERYSQSYKHYRFA
jgi:hypothetical protein